MKLLNTLSTARAKGLFPQKSFLGECLSSDLVGACVYITGPAVGASYPVTTAEPRDGATKMPSVGIIVEKASPTVCTVQVTGEMGGVVGSLTPGKVLFVAVDGSLTHTIPTALTGQFVYIQSMGIALSETSVSVVPDFSIIKRRG